jgi:hypothetical protein
MRTLIDECRSGSYLLPDVYAACREEVEADVADWFARARGFDANQRLHLYLLSEACLKYFGAEVSTERIYATNIFPFLDVDFFEFIIRAPFVGLNTRPVRPTVSDRFNSQYFYAYLIRKYRPELLSYTTDHGYPPADLLKSPPLLYAGPKYVWSRLRIRARRYREFKPQEWLAPYFRRHLFARGQNDFQIIAPSLAGDFESGFWRRKLTEFEKVAALRLWLETWV